MGIQVAVPETSARLLTEKEFSGRLEAIGEDRYHHRHPFHLLMHQGRLTPGQLQAWVLNRYYYQSRVPMKDAIILSRSDDLEFRRAWRKRLLDQDGRDGDGGVERWLKLAEATGLARERVTACAELLPGVRYAVDAYLALVERGTLLEAVASSLTELFASRLIAVRLDSLRRHMHGLAMRSATLKPGFLKPPKMRNLPLIGCMNMPATAMSRSWRFELSRASATCSGRNSMPCTSLMFSPGGLRPELFVRSKIEYPQ